MKRETEQHRKQRVLAAGNRYLADICTWETGEIASIADVLDGVLRQRKDAWEREKGRSDEEEALHT